MCALWANIDDNATEQISLTGYDIVNEKLQECDALLPVKRIYELFSKKYYDKRTFIDEKGIVVGLDGLEAIGKKTLYIKPQYNTNIMGYMIANSSGFDTPDLSSTLVVAGIYKGHGFYLRKDNYLEKLPMFAASRYITYNREWTERARIMKSADGAARFERDVKNGKLRQWLLKCLLFTCVEMQNHCRTFTGSDGRFYRNELCLDGTNGETIALRDLKKLEQGEKEKEMAKQWRSVLQYAKACDGYDKTLTYGVYQIFAELDTSHKDELGNTIYDNVELHTALSGLKQLVKNYYNTEIVPMLFNYDFLK